MQRETSTKLKSPTLGQNQPVSNLRDFWGQRTGSGATIGYIGLAMETN